MTEYTSSNPVLYEPLFSGRNDMFRFNYIARTPQPCHDENAWSSTTTDVDRVLSVALHDMQDSDDGAGESPWVDMCDDPLVLNNWLDRTLDNAKREAHFSLLSNDTEETEHGMACAIAIVSPERGFPKERLKRLGRVIRPGLITPLPVLPLLPGSESKTHSLYVATLPDYDAPRQDRIKQEQSRALMGAMAAYHVLHNLSPATTVQYSFPNNRLSTSYCAELMDGMGMNPTQATTRQGRSVSQNKVGEPGQRGTVLDSLLNYLQKSHTVTDLGEFPD